MAFRGEATRSAWPLHSRSIRTTTSLDNESVRPDALAIEIRAIAIATSYALPAGAGRVGVEFRQLRYLISIIDFGSFSKASLQLNIAQPALSQQIANLEIELKAELLVRSAKGVTPTEAGLGFYRHAQAILRQVEQAREDARRSIEDDALVGAVSVGLPPSAATILCLPLVRRVRSQLPGIRLRVIESLSGHLHEALINNRIDMAVLFRGQPAKSIQMEPIMEESLFLATSDSKTANQPFPVRQLSGLPLAIPGTPHELRALVDTACQKYGIELDIVAEMDSLPGLRGIAASGIAAVILPQSALMEPSAAGAIFQRPLVEPAITRPLSICRAEGFPATRPVNAVAGVLRGVMRELVESGRWSGARLLDSREGVQDPSGRQPAAPIAFGR